MGPKRTVPPTTTPPPPSSPPAVSPSVSANTSKPSTAASSKPPTPSNKHSRARASNPRNPSSYRSSAPQSRLEEAWTIGQDIWDRYSRETPVRTLVLDAFLAFLVVVGVLQFAYCLFVTAYPFNAFLSGFSACIGQFVLTASLRMQTNPENRKAFEGQQEGVSGAVGERISDERAFADFVFGSLVLHFFCVNFVN